MKAEFPLHRSVVFWLGWFVLIFLMWVWADSRKMGTGAFRVCRLERAWVGIPELHPRYIEGASVDSGRVFLTWTRVNGMGAGMRMAEEPFQIKRGATKLGGEWLAMPTWKKYDDKSVQGAAVVAYRVEVPMWGVVGVYVMMWGGVMVWRWWRWRRATALSF